MGRRYGKRIYHMVDTSRCGVAEQDGCLHSIARERAEFQKEAKKRTGNVEVSMPRKT